MCLALVKPAGKTIKKTEMHRAYTANKDGCGLAVRIRGEIRIAKGLWSFDECWKMVANLMPYDLLLHFRWASAGSVIAENCHPFSVVGGGALIHNGHLHGYGLPHKSDTACWVDEVLNPLLTQYPGALDSDIMRQLLGDSIGTSKMAIMTPDATVILNEDSGFWRKGVWYSNDCFLPPAPITKKAPLTSYYGRSYSQDPWPDPYSDLPDNDLCDVCGSGVAHYRVCRECFGIEEEDSPWKVD